MKVVQLVLLALLFVIQAEAALPAGKEPSSVEERRIRTAIDEQYNRIQKEGDQTRVAQMQLKSLQQEVDKKLVQMKNLRQKLTALLDRKQAAETTRVSDLGKIYEKMSAERAAVLVKNLEPRLAIELLAAMNKKNAGRILDKLDRKTATKLSTAFTELPVKQPPVYLK